MDAPDDEEAARALLVALDRVPRLNAALHRVVIAGPAPASAAAAERTEAFGELPWVLSSLRLVMGMDSLSVWHAVRIGLRLLPPAAHLTLCRGALEAAVTARWLIDPGATADQRRRRALGLQLEDFRWRSIFERRAKVPTPTAGKKGAELRSQASKLRVKPIGLQMAERMEAYAVIRSPDMTFRGGAMYGLLSSFAHAMEWSVLASKRADEHETPGVPEARTATVTADPVLAGAATVLAVNSMTRAVLELARYSGRTDDQQ